MTPTIIAAIKSDSSSADIPHFFFELICVLLIFCARDATLFAKLAHAPRPSICAPKGRANYQTRKLPERILSGTKEDAAAKAIVKKPVAVYIEKVYEEGDLSALGIGA